MPFVSKWKMPRLFVLCCFILLILLGTVGAYYASLPTQGYYQSILGKADRVEVGVSAVFNPAKVVDVAVITDPHEKLLLTESVKFDGPWVPFLEVAAGYTTRIRAIHRSEVHDIVIRGDADIKHGIWLVSISPSLMRTVEMLITKHGGRIPSPQELGGSTRE